MFDTNQFSDIRCDLIILHFRKSNILELLCWNIVESYYVTPSAG